MIRSRPNGATVRPKGALGIWGGQGIGKKVGRGGNRDPRIQAEKKGTIDRGQGHGGQRPRPLSRRLLTSGASRAWPRCFIRHSPCGQRGQVFIMEAVAYGSLVERMANCGRWTIARLSRLQPPKCDGLHSLPSQAIQPALRKHSETPSRAKQPFSRSVAVYMFARGSQFRDDSGMATIDQAKPKRLWLQYGGQ